MLFPIDQPSFACHIAQEAAAINLKLLEFLAGQTSLTLSYDGWSTRARDEIYTFHTTTSKRRSIFAAGHVFKGVSVTGLALRDVAQQVSYFIVVFLDTLLVLTADIPDHHHTWSREIHCRSRRWWIQYPTLKDRASQQIPLDFKCL